MFTVSVYSIGMSQYNNVHTIYYQSMNINYDFIRHSRFAFIVAQNPPQNSLNKLTDWITAQMGLGVSTIKHQAYNCT